jgi:uncharacterized protein YprB with RNaseH-like and TPR domain
VTKQAEVYLDIETSSLDADSGMIVAIGYATGNGESKILFVNSFNDEKNVISKAFDIIKDKEIITFNGSHFDIPFLIARGLKYNLVLPKIKMIDLYCWARKFLKLQSRRFHEICLFYDISHEEISGKEVNELFIKAMSGANNAKQRIMDHLNQDIEALQAFYKKISPLMINYPPPDPLTDDSLMNNR